MGNTMAVVGMGYVGLPLAVSFSRFYNVTGYDISKKRIDSLKQGIDPSRSVPAAAIETARINFSCKPSDIKGSDYIIVAVPTPVDVDNLPNLSPLIAACKTVGENLTAGCLVVFESTVYPGVTENICIPELEKASGLKCGKDFWVGYSPERINPGDCSLRFEDIVKVVSGCDEKALAMVSSLYSLIIDAGIYQAPSIRVAEAAKAVENAQRDINIAFMNELSILFSHLGIDTLEVLEAASTKWNFFKFTPGLVGGHCIGVDPYYLIDAAELSGYSPVLMSCARQLNESMAGYLAEILSELLRLDGGRVCRSRIGILGCAFKGDVADIRNSKIFKTADILQGRGAEIMVADPYADPAEVAETYGYELMETVYGCDAVVIATAHSVYSKLSAEKLKAILKSDKHVVMDVRGILNKAEIEASGLIYWRL